MQIRRISMKNRSLATCLIVATCLLVLVPVVFADDAPSPRVIYQTTFSTDPHWVTNTGGASSNYYWDSNLGMYYFSIEPSSGSYAFVPVDYERGPFTLEYDVILNRVDTFGINSGATFRLGLSGAEMDPSKGPIVLTQFTNAKFGQIMWLHLVTNGNKMVEVNSQHSDTLASGTKAYEGPTVKYELNKTYHVTATYDADNALLNMKVNEKTSGRDVWSYFVNVGEDLHGMNRIYIGSKGDYGPTGIYATGYIDNVRLTTPAVVEKTPAVTVVQTAITTRPTAIATSLPPIGTVPTDFVEGTPQSPSSAVIPVAAFALVALCIGIFGLKRRN